MPAATLRRLVRFVASAEGRRVDALDLAVVGPDEIADLNRRYRARQGPTDVLSFDLSEPGADAVSAQLVVCADAAAVQGPFHGNTPEDELLLYVIHGLLHLMGYDDTTPRTAARIRARQQELLKEFLQT